MCSSGLHPLAGKFDKNDPNIKIGRIVFIELEICWLVLFYRPVDLPKTVRISLSKNEIFESNQTEQGLSKDILGPAKVFHSSRTP